MKLFHIHDWTTWSDPVADHFGHEGKLMQVRECSICRKVQSRRIWMPVLSRVLFEDIINALRKLRGKGGE